MAKAIDLTGKRFGRLLVLGLNPIPYLSPSGKPTRRWDCICDCGTKVTVLANVLKSGHSNSCGCLQREAASRLAADLTGLRFGKWTVLERVPLEHTRKNGPKNGWLCQCDCGTRRVVEAKSLTSGASRSCGCMIGVQAWHRIEKENILGRYEGTVVTTIQPGRGPNSNNSSGVKGVHWSSSEKRWIARIGFRGKNITIGRYKNLEDAAKARKEAEQQYFSPVIDSYQKSKQAQK